MIESIILQNFRNYKFRQFEFSKKINFILGENGVGKTNLLEAISMICLSNGIRGADMQDLNQNYITPFAIGFETKIGRISISNASGAKKIMLEGEGTRLSTLLKQFQVVSLMPEDEFIFMASVSERRAFFDKIFGKITPNHLEILKNYKNLTTQRIKILQGNGDENWLLVVEKQIAEVAILIAINRVLIAEEISVFSRLHGEEELRGTIHLTGHLENKILEGRFVASFEEKKMREELAFARALDKITGKTLTGFERTNFNVMFEKKQILATKSSSGEQKKMVFSVLLACIKKIISANCTVFVLIDEVVSKLDARGRASIMGELKALPCQSFLTGTESFEVDNDVNTIEL